MLTIAITGGIGSGKSAVTSYLRDKGYIVVDADNISREITKKGGRSIPYIIEHFGLSFIDRNGDMDREKMRNLIYNNPEAKKILENGTTSAVIEEMRNIKIAAEKKGESLMFFDIPLLFETGLENEYDIIWFITADINKRIERIKKRDGLDEQTIRTIISNQMDESYKLDHCNCVIENNASFEDLYSQIDNLLSQLKI